MKTQAIDGESRFMKTKYQTLKKLIEFGLIREDTKTYKHNMKPVFCTELGHEVSKQQLSIERILN